MNALGEWAEDCGDGNHSMVWPEAVGRKPSVTYLICERCGFEFGEVKDSDRPGWEPPMVSQEWLVAANRRAEEAETKLKECEEDRSLALSLLTKRQRIYFWGTKFLRERGEL